MKALPYASLVLSPNLGAALAAPKYLVIHFTAGPTLEGATRWLCSPAAKASAHVVIGRDGRINQLVPFNRIAWHAGASALGGLVGLNKYSIGIELVNLGAIVNGRSVGTGAVVPAEEIFHGRHKNGGSWDEWQKYTDVQLEALNRVAKDILAQFPTIKDAVGHDDIAPNRKFDPGPAFDMKAFKTAVGLPR